MKPRTFLKKKLIQSTWDVTLVNTHNQKTNQAYKDANHRKRTITATFTIYDNEAYMHHLKLMRTPNMKKEKRVRNKMLYLLW